MQIKSTQAASAKSLMARMLTFRLRQKLVDRGAFYTYCQLFLTGILVLGAMTTTVSHLSAETRQSEIERGLVSYYLNSADKYFASSDPRLIEEPFTATVIVRKFTLDTVKDTVRLDTALIRLYYYGVAQSHVGSGLFIADSMEIIRSSFVEDQPQEPVLFYPPPWEDGGEFGLFPNDPGVGELAVSFERYTKDSASFQCGLFSLERANGELAYHLVYQESRDRRRVYTRETKFAMMSGFTVPLELTERARENSLWGNVYFVKEIRLLGLQIGE